MEIWLIFFLISLLQPKPHSTTTVSDRNPSSILKFSLDTVYPEKKVATLWGISSMKELDARYAKRVRTATAELTVYAKSMVQFIREYSDAMESIGIVPQSSIKSVLSYIWGFLGNFFLLTRPREYFPIIDEYQNFILWLPTNSDDFEH